MDTKQTFVQEVHAFWNRQSGLAEKAGTRDLIAKQLEIEAIAEFIKPGLTILEIGCGNGITAIELARRVKADITGIDYAEEMIAAANELKPQQGLQGTLNFRVGDVRTVDKISERYDLIYTERVLINLPDWQTQMEALINVTKLLAPGGLFVMCENSQDGLDSINQMRHSIGLQAIIAPWHNRYLRDAEINGLNIPGVTLEGTRFYSSTYYFLSRVVNAWIAAQENKEPDYDSPINKLALQLPAFGDSGQGRIWLWRKQA